jgi:hypothetical protein
MTGIKCPYWQDDSQQCANPKGDANSENACYNTGLVGGYYSPIKVKIRFVPSGRLLEFMQEGIRMAMGTNSWTIWTPRLAMGDFFVKRDGRRYEIGEVTQNLIRGLITNQVFKVTQKWPTDLLYAVPIATPL